MTNKTGIQTFRNGIHPEEFKHLTENNPIERMPFVDVYTLPLSQHIGAPCVAIVQKGDYVKRGQQIANPGGFVSVALHSPVDGTIQDIRLAEQPNGQLSQSIIIKTDPFSLQQWHTKPPVSPEKMSKKEFIESVQTSGLVGLGGAAFPAHVKFSVPDDKTCKYLILNGCECEPFLTSDHRCMLEYAEEIMDGTAILQRFIGAEKIFIGIENNKPDAIAMLNAHCAKSSLPIQVVPLKVKYPQGAEKMLITAILDVEVPAGKLPIETHALVSNISTIASLSLWFRKGIPLTERIVTVTGTAINRPSNVLVPIGTSMSEVVKHCGQRNEKASRILLGGPMMGMVQKTLDVPVVKGTSGILILTDKEVRPLQEYNCIRCSKCIEACPMRLNPSIMGLMARKGLWEEMLENNVMDCFECGCCSYVCPSAIPLVQSFRVAKSILREKKAKEVA